MQVIVCISWSADDESKLLFSPSGKSMKNPVLMICHHYLYRWWKLNVDWRILCKWLSYWKISWLVMHEWWFTKALFKTPGAGSHKHIPRPRWLKMWWGREGGISLPLCHYYHKNFNGKNHKISLSKKTVIISKRIMVPKNCFTIQI